MKTGSDKKYVVTEKVGSKVGSMTWYVGGLSYYDMPESDWILGPTLVQTIEKAMQFCEEKAKILARILSNQVDEEGYSAEYKVVKVGDV